MQLRISDDALLPDLLEYLSTQVDVVVDQVGPDRLEANVLGYGLDGREARARSSARAWEAAHPNATVEHVPSPRRFRARRATRPDSSSQSSSGSSVRDHSCHEPA